MSAYPRAVGSALPSGTVTFVFTDIEGSTQRADRDRYAMEAVVRTHDVLMRTAITAHGGYIFKTIGDAFCAAFRRPEDAVAAMLEAQKALGLEDFSAVGELRVRAAIHTGTADERDNDYFGPTVNRVARLVGIAHGGQVLLSGVTGDLLDGSLPQDASLRDLGAHRLRDLSRPEHVYQLVGRGLIADFPPLRSLGSHPNNLPVQTTSFVGRKAEVREIELLSAQHHLVTLVGSGGIGKTRASVHAAAHLLDNYPDGVWFIELAPLSTGDYLASTVAQAMGLSLPDGDTAENLVRVLHQKHALLVFDNCEHIIDAVAQMIGAILRGSRHVRVMTSSRQALGVAGEATFRMPSLPTETALTLFEDRARAADSRFRLTPENIIVVADICVHLDGIALAIELAAARIRILAPSQIRDRLDERFRVLTGGSRDALPRQQTLRALIDWSYELLDEREQRLFQRIAVFINTFTLDGVVAVCSDDESDELDVLDVLQSLVDKSLVLAESAGEVVRYRLLESTRAFALDKLNPKTRPELSSRHLRFFRDRFTALRADADFTEQQAELYAAFQRELDDLRLALDAALAFDESTTGADLLCAIEQTWDVYGLRLEAQARITSYIDALPPGETRLLAMLHALWSMTEWTSGHSTHAAQIVERGLSYAHASADGRALAFVLINWVRIHIKLGNLAMAQSALDEARLIHDVPPKLRVALEAGQSHVHLTTGNLAAAETSLHAALRHHRAIGSARAANITLLSIAEVEFVTGRTEAAIDRLAATLPELEQGPDDQLHCTVLENLAYYSVGIGDLREAERYARDVIARLAPREPAHGLIAGSLEVIATIDALEGDARRAAVLSAYVDTAFTRMGYERVGSSKMAHDRLLALLHEKFSGELFRPLFAEGAALTPEAAIQLSTQADAA